MDTGGSVKGKLASSGQGEDLSTVAAGSRAPHDSEEPFDAVNDRALLRGRYAVTRKLGQGGQAIVYLAMREGESRISSHSAPAPFPSSAWVAIKMLSTTALRNEQIVQLFAYEAQVALWVTAHPHPAIVRAHAFEVMQGTPVCRPYLVLDYVGDKMAREKMRNGPFPLIAAIDLTITLAGALGHLHQLGVIHGDVKPDNFVLHADRVTLIDFGLARPFSNGHVLPAPPVTVTRGGTPWYMAPEVVEGGLEPDPRGDVYSLGVCLYEFISGQAPYRGPSPTALRLAQRTGAYTRLSRLFVDVSSHSEKVIRELDELLIHALAFDQSRRFVSMEAFQQALRAVRTRIQREVGERTIHGPVLPR